jgi:hypothetical protein
MRNDRPATSGDFHQSRQFSRKSCTNSAVDVLTRRRQVLQQQVEPLTFLFGDYATGYWYFEVLEMVCNSPILGFLRPGPLSPSSTAVSCW